MNLTLNRPNLIKLLVVPLLVFAATMLVVRLIDSPSGSGSAGAGAGASASGFADARTTDERIRSLQAAVKMDTSRAAPYASLGDAYLQKARETADPAQYARAESALRAALQREPRDAGALTGMGSLANARHDFSAALRYGERARAAAPGAVKPYGVIVDAQVELGRYDAAERTLQRMVDLKPNLDSYARVSYFRELHGDLPGAVEAMRLAASAGGDARENFAYVQTLIGNLELAAGPHRRRRALLPPRRRALRRLRPGAGRARPRGDRARRPRRGDPPLPHAWSRACPLPEYVVGLAETELAAGRRGAAREDLALVEVQQRLLRRGGVNVDAEMAIVEADHGNPARAVDACAARLDGGPERAQCRRARLGADARKAAAGGPRVRAPRAAPRLPRRPLPLPRGHRRA